MKIRIASLLIVCLSICLFSCEKKGEAPSELPTEISELETLKLLESGFISKVELELKEDSITQRAVLYLNDAGKRSKYAEIGFQGENEIAYFWSPVKNPFVFSDSVKQIKQRISKVYESAEADRKKLEKDKYVKKRNEKDFYFARIIIKD